MVRRAHCAVAWRGPSRVNRRERRAARKRFPVKLEVLPLQDPASQDRIAVVCERYERMLKDPMLTPAERAELEQGQQNALATQRFLAMLDPERPEVEAMH